MRTEHRGKGNLCENLIFCSGIGEQSNHGVVRFIDFGNERGCFCDDMIGYGLSDVCFGDGGVIVGLIFSGGRFGAGDGSGKEFGNDGFEFGYVVSQGGHGFL